MGGGAGADADDGDACARQQRLGHEGGNGLDEEHGGAGGFECEGVFDDVDGGVGGSPGGGVAAGEGGALGE